MLSVFDGLFGEVRKALSSEFRQGEVAQDCGAVVFGEHANRGVILSRDTAVELGSSTEGSCAFTLASSNDDLVIDGCVSILGSDIFELQVGGVAPFAQIILVSGQDLGEEDYQTIAECQQVKDYIDGYLVRGTQKQVWARVSHRLYEKQFSFAFLGAALSDLIKARVPAVEKAEFVFVTSSKIDVMGFDAVQKKAIEIAHDIRKDIWLEKGIDIDCPYGAGHCGKCDMKETCNEVRKIKGIREKEKTNV